MAKLTLDFDAIPDAGPSTVISSGKGGKVCQYGNVMHTVSALIETLNDSKDKDGRSMMVVKGGELWFANWKLATWGANAPAQSFHTYVGHYNRLEHGYGPAAAYTSAKRDELKSGARTKYAKASIEPKWDIPNGIKADTYGAWFKAKRAAYKG